MEPILHLSIPVRDLPESIDFYVDSLGCELGRVRDRFADVWFFGMQLTLQARPDQVRAPEPGDVRHFGVTLSAGQMDALVARAESSGVHFAGPVSTDDAGTPWEQTKTKILDPSGNVIEIKTYVDPVEALGIPRRRPPTRSEESSEESP
jgi:extradiol dioxygenase family protein